MWYSYRIPGKKPKTYLVTDELFTSNVSKMRCEYAEETKELLLSRIKDYPTLNKRKNSQDYKELKTVITWTPLKTKSGKLITPVTRREYFNE